MGDQSQISLYAHSRDQSPDDDDDQNINIFGKKRTKYTKRAKILDPALIVNQMENYLAKKKGIKPNHYPLPAHIRREQQLKKQKKEQIKQQKKEQEIERNINLNLPSNASNKNMNSFQRTKLKHARSRNRKLKQSGINKTAYLYH